MKVIIYTALSTAVGILSTLLALMFFYSKDAKAYRYVPDRPLYDEEQLECLTLGIYGEHGQRGNYEGRLNVAAFIINEAFKASISICKEISLKKGKHKYSFYRYKNSVIKRSKKNRMERNAWSECHGIATQFLSTHIHDHMLESRRHYTNYITEDLAKSKRAPSWFKDYIVSYEIDGSHVMAQLDFSKKRPETYKRLLKDLTY